MPSHRPLPSTSINQGPAKYVDASSGVLKWHGDDIGFLIGDTLLDDDPCRLPTVDAEPALCRHRTYRNSRRLHKYKAAGYGVTMRPIDLRKLVYAGESVMSLPVLS